MNTRPVPDQLNAIEEHNAYLNKMADEIEAEAETLRRELVREGMNNFVKTLLIAKREETIRECATAARMLDRLEHEWVKDSIWDNITKRVEARILGLLP